MEHKSIAVMGGFPLASGNLGYYFAKYLTKIGLNATLIIKETHLHEWRGLNPEEDPYTNKIIKVIPYKKSENKIARQLREIFEIRKYDFVISIGGAGMWYLPFLKKPYIAYATGADLVELAGGQGYSGYQVKQAQRFFKKAKLVFYGPENVAIEAIKKLGLKKTIPWRQIIDIEFCSTENNNDEKDKTLKIFNPSSQHWIPKFPGQRLKSNDIFFKGFSLFLDNGGDGIAYYVKRGQNFKETEKLLFELKITDKVIALEPEEDPFERKKRVEKMDIVADQFGEGIYGLIALEAMSLGKPVLTFFSKEAAKITFSEDEDLPPFLNCSTPEEIASHLTKMQVMENRLKKSIESRKWIEKYHDPIILIKWYWKNIEKCLET